MPGRWMTFQTESEPTCFMPFGQKLFPALYIRRINRFVVVVEIEGRQELAHLHDPGRLKEILIPGTRLFLTKVSRSGRKTPFTATLADCDTTLVSINSTLPNRFVEFCLNGNYLYEFRDFSLVRREVPFDHSRLDFHLIGAGVDILLEVKSVTLVENRSAYFPDAPTSRGVKHVRELIAAAHRGFCGTIFFLVQRDDADVLYPNRDIDPLFADQLNFAYSRGIEIIAYTSHLSMQGISLGRRIPVRMEPPVK